MLGGGGGNLYMYAVDISEFKKLHAQRQHPRQCQLKK